MAGQPGRSGGHNRKPVAFHVAAGSYRPDRHAARAVAEQQDRPPVEPPDLSGLGAAGRRFVERILAVSEPTDESEVVLLVEAGHLMDRLAALRANGPPSTVRLELAIQRQLSALLQQLRVRT